MRRNVSLALVCALVLGSLLAATPAGAGAPSRAHYRSSVLNVFWYSRHRVSRDVHLRVTWSVGVYEQDGEIWSDLYQSVTRCERRDGRTRCRPKYFRYGDSDLAGATYELARDLSASYLDATYELQKFVRRDGRTRRVGDPVPVRITTDVVGVGELARFSYTDTFTSGCISWRYRSRGISRGGKATGRLNGRKGLGKTGDVWMSRGNTLWMERSC